MKDPVTGKPLLVVSVPNGVASSKAILTKDEEFQETVLSAFVKAFFIAAVIKLAVVAGGYIYSSKP